MSNFIKNQTKGVIGSFSLAIVLMVFAVIFGIIAENTGIEYVDWASISTLFWIGSGISGFIGIALGLMEVIGAGRGSGMN